MDYFEPTPGPLKPFPQGVRLIVCCRPGDPYLQDVPGAQYRDCWQCDEVVRASPSAQAMHAAGGHVIMCVQCVAAYCDAGIAITLAPATAEQIKERRAARLSAGLRPDNSSQSRHDDTGR